MYGEADKSRAKRAKKKRNGREGVSAWGELMSGKDRGGRPQNTRREEGPRYSKKPTGTGGKRQKKKTLSRKAWKGDKPPHRR